MGRLIKNQLARLIVLTAAVYHTWATIEAFIWPKFFWDFFTRRFDGAVRPVPILQILNIIIAVVMVAYEWPLPLIAGTAMHRSVEARLVLIPLPILLASLLYQTTNAAIYYIVGEIIYFWAFTEGESVTKDPWERRRPRAKKPAPPADGDEKKSPPVAYV